MVTGIIKKAKKKKPTVKGSAKVNPIKEQWMKLKLKNFKPKFPFEIEHNGYIVRTANTAEDLLKVVALRELVFYKERLDWSRSPTSDFNEFDRNSDHILIENKDREVLGTYRLIFSEDNPKMFASEEEYTIEKFLAEPGTKLELGRACIHADHRTGTSISLMWKGIAHYVNERKVDFLFGCASCDIIHPYVAFSLFHYLKDHFDTSYDVDILPKYKFDKPPQDINPEFIANSEKLLPSLLGSYLKAGARIYSEPALDRFLRTTDFFTILKISEMDEKFKKRYLK